MRGHNIVAYVWVLGMGIGVDEGWIPLPTCLQQYCDPASLVLDSRGIGQILRAKQM